MVVKKTKQFRPSLEVCEDRCLPSTNPLALPLAAPVQTAAEVALAAIDPASTALFLKMEGVTGESTDALHPGEIQLESFSWGASRTSSAGVPLGVQDFHVVMRVNKASPQLLALAALGQHIPTAVLSERRLVGSQQDFLTWTFTDVFVSSFQTRDLGGLPAEEVTFSFATLVQSYRPLRADGTLGEPIVGGLDVGQFLGA